MSRNIVILALVLGGIVAACGTQNSEIASPDSGGIGGGTEKGLLGSTTPCKFKQVEVPAIALETLPPKSVLFEPGRLGSNPDANDWGKVRVAKAFQTEDCSITVVAAVQFLAGGSGPYDFQNDFILVRRIRDSKVDMSFGNRGWFASAYLNGKVREPHFADLFLHPTEDSIYVFGTVQYTKFESNLVVLRLERDGSLDTQTYPYGLGKLTDGGRFYWEPNQRAFENIPLKNLATNLHDDIQSIKIEEVITHSDSLEIKGVAELSTGTRNFSASHPRWIPPSTKRWPIPKKCRNYSTGSIEGAKNGLALSQWECSSIKVRGYVNFTIFPDGRCVNTDQDRFGFSCFHFEDGVLVQEFLDRKPTLQKRYWAAPTSSWQVCGGWNEDAKVIVDIYPPSDERFGKSRENCWYL